MPLRFSKIVPEFNRSAPRITPPFYPLYGMGTSTFSLPSSATGPGPLTYQWYKNGILQPGRTTSTYLLSTSEFGVFTYVATNPFGSKTSSTIQTYSGLNTSFISNSPDVRIPLNSTTTISATVNGSLPIQITWRKAGVTINSSRTAVVSSSSGGYYGPFTAFYTVSSGAGGEGYGTYDCVFSNQLNTSLSYPTGVRQPL